MEKNSTVVSLKQNTLKVICSKLESELDLHKALHCLTTADQATPYGYTVLSSVNRVSEQVYGLHGEEQYPTELKISFVSSARRMFLDNPPDSNIIEETDIVGQVRVVKGLGEEEFPPVSTTEPWAIIKRLALFNFIDFSVGMFQTLVLYTQGLWDNGFRIAHMSNSGDRFDLFLVKSDVLVKIVVYTADFKEADLYIAHQYDVCLER